LRPSEPNQEPKPTCRPAYDGYCALRARRGFGLPRCGQRHPGRRHLARLSRIRRGTAALIRDLAMQHEQFRAEMDEHPRLIVPGEDSARPFGAMKTPGQDA
jgi:hypothetical protein